MLAIRLQRLGRKAMPVYRVAVQEAQRHPSSGRVVAYIGTYNPHTKESKLDKEKTEFYLKNGAQPTSRVVRLIETAKITLPSWVKKTTVKEGKVRNAEKLRRNQPKTEVAAEQPAPATEAESAEEKTES